MRTFNVLPIITQTYMDDIEKIQIVGSGSDSVGRVVASDARGPRFESSHRQISIWNNYLPSTILKRRK